MAETISNRRRRRGGESREDSGASATKVFRRVHSILPREQHVFTLSPNIQAGQAIQLLSEKGFSQAPVVDGPEILGVFSFRSFARGVVELNHLQLRPADLPVDEFLEKPAFASLADEIERIVDDLDRQDVVLVRSGDRLVAVATPMDVLRYFKEVADPFVMLQEIELALRELFRMAIGAEDLQLCIEQVIGRSEALDQLSFDEHVALVRDGRTWPKFGGTFGSSRDLARTRLEAVRDIRNALMHFRRDATAADHQSLADARRWLLSKAQMAERRRREVGR